MSYVDTLNVFIRQCWVPLFEPCLKTQAGLIIETGNMDGIHLQHFLFRHVFPFSSAFGLQVFYIFAYEGSHTSPI